MPTSEHEGGGTSLSGTSDSDLRAVGLSGHRNIEILPIRAHMVITFFDFIPLHCHNTV